MSILRFALLGLAACVALFLGWSFLQDAIRPDKDAAVEAASQKGAEDKGPSSPQAVAAARRAIEADIAAAPEYAPFFNRLKTGFPAEYESVLATFSAKSAASGEIAGVDLLLSEAVRALRLSHGVLAARAGGAALDHVFEAQVAILRALAGKDQRLCVDFLFGGVSGDFLQFSAENRPLVAAMAIAGIDAISDGQVKRVEREPPTQKDFQTLEEMLRARGLDTAEIEALLDGKAADPSLDDKRMCRAGGVYLDTLATLPEPARERIYGLAVELMARS